MKDLLIITHEHIGPRMAGPGIRAWEIARALARSGWEVLLATPYPEIPGEGSLSVVGFTWEDPGSLEQWLGSARVVMATGPVLSRVVHRLQAPLNQPIIVDLYYVPEIEIVLLNIQKKANFLIDLLIEETLVYLCYGDFFLYATERQRDFWLGALWMAGRLNDRIRPLPYSAHPEHHFILRPYPWHHSFQHSLAPMGGILRDAHRHTSHPALRIHNQHPIIQPPSHPQGPQPKIALTLCSIKKEIPVTKIY